MSMGGNSPLTGEAWQPDLFSGSISWGHAWDTRLKIVSLLVFVFSVVALNNLYTLLISWFLVTVAIVTVKIRFSLLFKRIKGVLPFLVFIYVGLILGRGSEHLVDSLYLGGVVSLKALASIMATYLLLGTASIEQVLKGLSSLRVPSVVTAVLFLSYRYLFMFGDIFHDTRRALAARGFNHVFGRKALKVYGEICGALFVKALDRSEIVMQSMEARGFNGSGSFYSSLDTDIQINDVLKTVLVILLVTMLFWLDRSVFA